MMSLMGQIRRAAQMRKRFRGKRRQICVQFALLLASLLLLCASPFGISQNRAASESFREIESLIQQHRFAEAKTALLGELRQHPSSVEAYNLLGIVQTEQQDYAGAIASLQKGLKIDPRSTKTHNNLGSVYLAQQQPAQAEGEFRTVLRLDPANAEANYNLGVLLIMKGTPADAIPHFERVHPFTTAAQFNLVRAYLQTRRTADALRVAAELSDRAQADVAVHFTLGVLLASEKQYKPARLELEKADALRPETFEILYNLGQVLIRASDNAKAQVILNR